VKTHTRVLVIGGGVVGCSVLYHLTKLGWHDIMLVERSELTSGSTWHAAGGFHTLNADTNMAALQGYTIRLYRELEELTGMSCGLHHVGGVTLATTPDRLDFLKAERAKHRYMGLDTEIIGPEEVAKLSPITNTEGVLGALYDPLDGHLDPSGTTHAYAKAARMAGAEIVLRNPVLETKSRYDGTWDVVTQNGTIRAEHVVNAAGLWAREVGQLAGVYLPLHPVEHQYLVTEETPEVYDRPHELPHVMDPEGESYLRQEGRGLVIGFYEQDMDLWGIEGTPEGFGHELLKDNLDRISDAVEFAYRRFPVLERAGIKTIINGPFTFAPDGNPLIGPVPGLRNYWAACAVMAGFSQGGGVGLSLAQWMVEGEPERDVFAADVARFGPWITPGYTRAKVRENYQRRFSVSYPNEELPAARPLNQTPMYDIFEGLGAVWGHQYGLEVPNYFAQGDEPRFETPSFRRSNAFEAVARECRAVREGVGINEVHNFSKFSVSGPDAMAWLDRMLAGRLPKPGRISLSPLLSPQGRLIGDFTVACLGRDDYRLTASYGAQAFHERWFRRNLASHVYFRNISDLSTGFQIAGPKARDLMAAVAGEAVRGIRFMDVREVEIGRARCLVQRLSYTGDLGYEIYCSPLEQRHLWEVLWEAGRPFGLTPFGMRAMMSLRLEKFFGSWLREFKPEYRPAETGLDRFVAYSKPADFIGKAAALKERAEGPARKICAFLVEAEDADVVAYEPIFVGDEVVGFCTSGGYAHYSRKSVALGFLPVELIEEGREVEIEILGRMRPARLVTTPLFDADGSRMRG
jgi:dimethylglycine dehydrogenase